jgi:hypothetical protein
MNADSSLSDGVERGLEITMSDSECLAAWNCAGSIKYKLDGFHAINIQIVYCCGIV